MKSAAPLVVFSDLDGTLLDHETYDWRAAQPALDRLAQIGAPVVLASSKTAREIRVLQEEMGLTHCPAIVENGAGLIQPETQDWSGPPPYTELRAIINAVPPSLAGLFRGFGDMSLDDVIRHTGLPADAAERAKDRVFSEPGIWTGTDTELTQFRAYLHQHGVSARMGGRFLTLSFGATKADQMQQVTDALQPAHSIALGDAPNDIEMIEKAEFGVIIANPHHSALPALGGEKDGRILRTHEAGPLGWNTAVLSLIDRLGL